MNMNQKGFANIILVVVIVILVGAVGYFAFVKKSASPTPAGQPQSTHFNFIFRYGIGAKNELDTFNQTYTKDMVMDSSITIKFKLSDSELAGINQKINDLQLFDKSWENSDRDMVVTPCSSYYLKAQIDSTQKELSWNNCIGRVSDKLRQFTNYIIQIIESKNEYKALPTPEAGYL